MFNRILDTVGQKVSELKKRLDRKCRMTIRDIWTMWKYISVIEIPGSKENETVIDALF
jgi:hypothetical protein